MFGLNDVKLNKVYDVIAGTKQVTNEKNTSITTFRDGEVEKEAIVIEEGMVLVETLFGFGLLRVDNCLLGVFLGCLLERRLR